MFVFPFVPAPSAQVPIPRRLRRRFSLFFAGAPGAIFLQFTEHLAREGIRWQPAVLQDSKWWVLGVERWVRRNLVWLGLAWLGFVYCGFVLLGEYMHCFSFPLETPPQCVMTTMTARGKGRGRYILTTGSVRPARHHRRHVRRSSTAAGLPCPGEIALGGACRVEGAAKKGNEWRAMELHCEALLYSRHYVESTSGVEQGITVQLNGPSFMSPFMQRLRRRIPFYYACNCHVSGRAAPPAPPRFQFLGRAAPAAPPRYHFPCLDPKCSNYTLSLTL
eukprot:gene23302-biopygen7278